MRPTNWVYTAAAEIQDVVGDMDLAPAVEDIIAKHCPFKPNTLYMPVPRCDGCKYWAQRETYSFGRCGYADTADALLGVSMYDYIVTEPDFGCVQWEART